MKVVLFCGGMGTRMREFSDTIPKPLVNVGPRPIIWHLMRYYAHFGHRDFVLCLGYKGELIREYFLNYDPLLVDECCLEKGKARLLTNGTDVPDWNIHFIDTGIKRNVGERLMAVRHLLQDEPAFLANYSDQLCDMDLNAYLDSAKARGSVASFLAVRPSGSFHRVEAEADGVVRSIKPMAEGDIWINGGYMVLRRDIFNYMEPGDELVEAPFARLIAESQLYVHRHTGFWKSMDTFKDKMAFDSYYENGTRPWEVWLKSC